jgi:hypothetical protein
LKNIIRLIVPKDEKDKKDKEYTYTELVDLHDKLTLVVGKMEDQQKIIHYFEDVLIEENSFFLYIYKFYQFILFYLKDF